MPFICSNCEAQCDDVQETVDGALCADCAKNYVECENCGKLVRDGDLETRCTFHARYDRNQERWEPDEYSSYCKECWVERDKRRRR